MRFHVVYRSRSARWGGDLYARVFKDILEQLGFEAMIHIDKVPLDYNKEAMFLVDHRAICLMEGVWEGPVFIYNVCEAFIGAQKWLRGFGQYTKHIKLRITHVFDYCPMNVKPLQEIGINCFLTPIGYHEFFEKRNMEEPTLYPVCFFGTKSCRRNKMFRHLRGKGIRVLPSLITEEERDVGAYNDKILRSDLHLHVHQSRVKSKSNFPSTRIMGICIPNRIPVVCEESKWSPIKAGGIHYHTFPYGDPIELHNKIKYVQKRPEQTQKMVERAYNFLKNEYRFVDHFRASFKKAGLL